jgi:hypothetical protein
MEINGAKKEKQKKLNVLILLVKSLDQVYRPIEKPFGNHQRDLRLRRVPRRVKLRAVDDILGAEVSWDEICKDEASDGQRFNDNRWYS